MEKEKTPKGLQLTLPTIALIVSGLVSLLTLTYKIGIIVEHQRMQDILSNKTIEWVNGEVIGHRGDTDAFEKYLNNILELNNKLNQCVVDKSQLETELKLLK